MLLSKVHKLLVIGLSLVGRLISITEICERGSLGAKHTGGAAAAGAAVVSVVTGWVAVADMMMLVDEIDF